MKRNAGTDAPICLHPEKPVVISSCWALCKRGGYGTRFGVPVDTRSEIKAEIRKLKSAGADVIKVMASGIVSIKTRYRDAGRGLMKRIFDSSLKKQQASARRHGPCKWNKRSRRPPRRGAVN
jgi:hypothetical protein